MQRVYHKSLIIFKRALDGGKEQKWKLFKRKFTDVSENSSSASLTNVGQLLELCERKLLNEEILDSRIDVEYIISRALNISRVNLHLYKNEVILSKTLEDVNEMMRCRLSRMPIQYILGDWDFHSVTLKMRPPVFIPRPETEELVNLALRLTRETGVEKPKVLDVCCGSGAISLALLKNDPRMTCVALDQSKYAVDLTLENAQDLQVQDRLHVIQGKVEENVFPNLPFDKFDLIVSNPPYVLKRDLVQLQPEIMLYEDMRALYGGVDGLDIIKNILINCQQLINENGHILLEIDPAHFESLPTWLEGKETTLQICHFYKDINGLNRYVDIKRIPINAPKL